MIEEVYLGDGLYVSFDGFQIKLRAPRGCKDHEVYLDNFVLMSFLNWLSDNKLVTLGKAKEDGNG